MSDSETIRVEGTSGPRHHGANDRSVPIVMGLLGLGVGVVLAAGFIASPRSEPQETSPTGGQRIVSPVPVPTTPTTAARPTEPTLAELAPMLDSDLIGIGTDIRGSATTERWRLPTDAPTTLDLPLGAASTDPSGRWLSLLTQGRYSDDLALWVGNPVYAEPLSTSVLGAVWSSDQAATIAWTERRQSSEAAETVLFTQGLTGSSLAGRSATVIPGDLTPVWFTVAGVVLFDAPGTLSLVTPEGDVLSTLEIERFHAATDRFALVEADGRSVLVSPLLDIIDEFPTDVSGCAIARFAPVGVASSRRVAMECQRPEGQVLLHVWDIAEHEAGIEVSRVASLPQLNLSVFAWAGRNVLIASLPVNSGVPETLVTVWDVEAGESERISWPGLVYQIIPVES